MAAVYVAVGWLLTQVAATLEGAIGLPEWFDGMIVALLALGFPLAILFSWAFEITPDGVKRTAEVDQSVSIAPSTGRKLDYILLAAAGLAIAVVVADRLAPRKSQAAAPASPAQALASGDERSIAVLPFADLSPDGDQEYFADGLSDELLNVLAQSHDLKVAGRTSSFAFKGQGRDLREVGEILNVAHILEGSVRKSGERIRVTAQLIKASDGYHVFSETYDRELKDIFAVQDDLAGKIGAALKARLAGDKASEAAPAALEAYDLYLLARQRIYSRDLEQMREAYALLDRALALDPDYAPALAQKAIATMLLSDASGSYGDTPRLEAQAASRDYIDRALALDPGLAEAHAARGLQKLNAGENFDDIRASLERALNINPNLTDAQNWLAIAYLYKGEPAEARRIYEGIVTRDPLYGPALTNLIFDYSAIGAFDEAEALIARVERALGGESVNTMVARGGIALTQGRLAEAMAYWRKEGAGSSGLAPRLYYGLTLLQLGEAEAAVDIFPSEDKIISMHLMGRTKEALSTIERWPPPTYGEPYFLRSVFFLYAATGNYEKAAQYLTRHFGDAASAAAAEPFNARLWLGLLAHSYKKSGREADFERTVGLLKTALEQDLAAEGDWGEMWHGFAELAALEDEKALAIEHLAKAMKKGWIGAFGFYSPVFDDLRGDPSFMAMEAEMRVKVNAERAKLCMKPL